MLMFSFVHAFRLTLKVLRFLMFLMSCGKWFHVEADLTMKDLLEVGASGVGRFKLVVYINWAFLKSCMVEYELLYT